MFYINESYWEENLFSKNTQQILLLIKLETHQEFYSDMTMLFYREILPAAEIIL